MRRFLVRTIRLVDWLAGMLRRLIEILRWIDGLVDCMFFTSRWINGLSCPIFCRVSAIEPPSFVSNFWWRCLTLSACLGLLKMLFQQASGMRPLS